MVAGDKPKPNNKDLFELASLVENSSPDKSSPDSQKKRSTSMNLE